MPDSTTVRRIGILTGGGDAPGLNAVIRAVVKTAWNAHGWTTLGIEDGFEGLLGPSPLVRELGPSDVRGLLPRGGTILGTTNKGRFRHETTPDGRRLDPEPVREAVRSLRALGLDALVAIGGDGTQTIAHAVSALGFPVVGVPKTIDNDLAGTDQTFGFASALETATDAIDRLHTTAESHDRVIVVEVMGRTAGWIALTAAIAGGADVALIPELPFSFERVAEAVRVRDRSGARFSIVVAAEGAAPTGGEALYVDPIADDAPKRLGGIGELVARRISAMTDKEARVCVLGHLQRGGSPTASDRVLATSFGAAAVEAIATGSVGTVVVLRGAAITPIPLAEVAGRVRRVPPDGPLVRTALGLGIELGVEPEAVGAARQRVDPAARP